VSARPDWASWPEAAWLTEEQIETLEAVSAEARERGLVVHLPVGDLAECAYALSEADAEDLASRLHEVRS
jgi:hypothetical protein